MTADLAPKVAEEQPVFSVIVATYARPEKLAKCLQGFAELAYPRERFEVVVSDDGSPVPLEPVLEPFRDRLRLVYVVGLNTGPGGARNRGAERASGRYLAFMDDDCVPDPEWLAALERRLAETPDALVGGRIVNALPANPFATTTQLIVSYVYEYFEREPRRIRFFNPSFAVPADRYRELGGFSENFPVAAGEDHDFSHRWQFAGGRTVYAPEAVVYHSHNLTLWRFFRQHFDYGRGLFTCRRRIAERTGQRLRGERPEFYLNLLRFPLQQGSGSRRWLHAGLLVLSQAATLVGAGWEAALQTRRRTSEDSPA